MMGFINYELALKLKDAGFPQEPLALLPNSQEEVRGAFYYSYPKGGGCGGLAFLNHIEYPQYLEKNEWTTIKAPTLSELIEATGLCRLTCSYGMESDNEWVAEPYTQDFNPAWIGKGVTAVEAVANLWLALKK